MSYQLLGKESGAGLLKWVLILAVITVAGAGVWRWKHPEVKRQEYKTAKATRGELIQMVTATGQLNPVTNVQVGSQISGMIQKIFVDYNSRVTNGEIIAQIDPATYKAMVSQAEGDLANAKAAGELAKAEWERQKALYESKIVARSDYDSAVASLHQADAQIMMKQAALDQSKVNLDYTTIYAPVDGIIISRNIDVGQTVAASFSSPTLFMIANKLTQMQIDAMVSEADVGGVEPSQKVDFSVDAFPMRTFHGSVVQVRNSPQTNQNVITYDTVIAVDNSDLKLRPGMTANVHIITARKDGALKVPNGALRFHPIEPKSTNSTALAEKDPVEGGKDQAKDDHVVRKVYVPVKGADGNVDSLKSVSIETGINDGIYTQVLGGLKEGDEVVVDYKGLTEQSGASNPFGMRRF